MTAYYNEIDPYAAEWLRNLIAAGHIAPGVVDTRSIEDVRPDELAGYTQCHFFAGIGVWSRALRLAGWPDDRPVWTGSCPCQPFSAAGKQEGVTDARHLWPAWSRLIAQCRPAVVFGEQVEAAIKHGWLDLVYADLEECGYAIGAGVLPAASVGAPHGRHRLWFVADRERTGLEGHDGDVDDRDESGWLDADPPRPVAEGGGVGGMADAECGVGDGRADLAERSSDRRAADRRPGAWDACDWLPCIDGKARPVEPGTFPLAHGVAARVGKLRAYGNAIVPQVAAEVIGAYLDLHPG